MSRQKLTEELIDEITLYIENGHSNVDACALAGISESTLYLWLSVPDSDDPKHSNQYRKLCEKLRSEMKIALVKFKQFHIGNINTASRSTWQASAWMLERKFPKEYARRLELTGEDGEPFEPVVIYLPDNGRKPVNGD